MDQEPQPPKQIAGDRLLKRLGTDPKKWAVGDRLLALLGVGLSLAVVSIAVCGYVFDWEWTGLPHAKVPPNTQPTKTLWDWLDLLIVPVVLAIGGYLFNSSQNRATQAATNRQAKTDNNIAELRRQDDALQAYLDHMSDLLIPKKDQPSLSDESPHDSLRTLAQARTLTILPRLDGHRKARVMQFLYEAGLIAKDSAVINLKGADLRGADLRNARLDEAHLGEADLRGAILSGASLERIALSKADLRGAILRKAYLTGADLYATKLRGADLWMAYMYQAQRWTPKQLGEAKSLKGATMPDGKIIEGAEVHEGEVPRQGWWTVEEWLKRLV